MIYLETYLVYLESYLELGSVSGRFLAKSNFGAKGDFGAKGNCQSYVHPKDLLTIFVRIRIA